MKTKLYSPPPGYYDLPFTWVFDGSQLVDGTNAVNQAIRIKPGYGDFVPRRIVGLDRVLATPANGGKVQVQLGTENYLESDPIATPSADIPIVPEGFVPENGSIYMDLYNVLKKLI